MLIYVNGCSHSIGIRQTYSWSSILIKSICRDGYYFNSNSVDDIKLVLDRNVLYNFSDSGKANDMIYYETLEFLSKCKAKNTKPDYVFIQWSGPSRVTRQNYEGDTIFLGPGDNDINILSFEPFASRRTVSYMFSLQEILKSMDIEYYFCNYMELDLGIKKYHLTNEIDFEKFISFNEESHPMFDGFRNLMRKYGYCSDANGHPNFFGHWYISNKFLEKLNVANLDVGFMESFMICHDKLPYYSNKVYNMVSYYDDNMIPRSRTKNLWKKIGEASEEIKNKFRKSIL